MTVNQPLDTDTINHPTLQRLVRDGALAKVTVAGDPDGWAIIAHVRQTQYPLVGQKSGVRHFRRMESAVRYLRQVGVERFEVDATRFDEVVMRRTRRRPDTAATRKRAHDATEYDRWFRKQVAEGIAEADNPDAEWYTPEQVRASAMVEIKRVSKTNQ